jgi:predicted nucleic acid-binding protein
MNSPTAPAFVDANIFLRYLTRDHAQHSRAVLPLFESLEEGTVSAVTSVPVLVEVVHVLSSRSLYNLPREDVRRHLLVIVNLRGLKLVGKGVLRRALDVYVQHNVDFTDALIVAQMEQQGLDTLLSFDRDFDRIKTINRHEPSAGEN